MAFLTPGMPQLLSATHCAFLGTLYLHLNISSASINSCDIVEISSNAVSALHQSLWLVGTSWIWLELARSCLSVHGINRNHMV